MVSIAFGGGEVCIAYTSVCFGIFVRVSFG